jgi:hypothetical protein
MAITREQFMVGIIHVDDLVAEGQWFVFDEGKYYDVQSKSKKVTVSESRVFRKFCFDREPKFTLRRDENGRIMRDETGDKLYDEKEVRSAKEFVVINLSNPKKKALAIKSALARGVKIRHADGTETIYRRVLSSASKTRVGKRLFTSLDPEYVREIVSFGSSFPDETVIAKMEARFGQAESSTVEIKDEDYSFDIMPDYEIERAHNVITYDWKKKKLNKAMLRKDMYNPLDGQGTMLPSAAVRTAHRLAIISRQERSYLLEWLEVYNEDARLALTEGNDEFLRLWAKIPSAFQIRFGFAKGLLVVYPHNLETTDCNGKSFRADASLANRFFGEKKHRYDFNKDIMFTDSMWKENFDPKYLTDDVPTEHRANLEIVLWQKNRKTEKVFMGYQYWQALNLDIVSPKEYANKAIDELKETIFTNADDAKAFLGMYDTGNDPSELEEKANGAGGKIQKVIEMLNENPEVIAERYVQDTIRSTREKYISDMKNGRIAVDGGNPYIISCPELQFGNEPLMHTGEYYYNGRTGRFSLFRSPLIHKSEPVVVETMNVEEYNVFFKDLLIMNPFDDTLPRMGGADTDGDKVAMVEDDKIADAVHTGLPMLFDAGFNADKEENNRKNIWKYDVATIINDVKSIGEITNMSTTFKDIEKNPALMKRLGLTPKRIDEIVCILRFMQGWSIDYAKTGFFPDVPEYVLTLLSPHWKPWSRKQEQLGIKGAEVYKSKSQLGQLHNSVTDYMENKFKQETKENTRDFTFEVTAGADYAEIERIKPIIAQMESNYRHELQALRDMKMTDEEESEYMTYLFDKYQSAVQSIDSDIRSISAAAYVHTYFESSSKGKSVSFPWVTAYEGILLNIADSTDTKSKLRKAKVTGHIDDVPASLKFFRGVSKDEDYTVEAKVPNGTYETFRRNGQLFIKMTTKATTAKKKFVAPINRHASFEIKGFKHADITPNEVIELLKENDGIVRVERVFDKNQQVKENRAVVYVGDRRVGVVGRNNKHIIAPFLGDGAVEFRVENLDNLKGEYLAKRTNTMKAVSFFNFDLVLVQFVEKKAPSKKVKETVEEEAPMSYDEYEGAPQDVHIPSDEPTVIEMDMEFDDEDVETSFYTMDEAIYDRLNKRADYWDVNVDAQDFNIIGASVESFNDTTYEVVLTREDGKTAKFMIDKSKELKQFVMVEGSKNESLNALALQIAHYELYVDHIRAKQA